VTQSVSEDMPNQMYMTDLVLTVAPDTLTVFAGSVFDKAPIGSMCRLLVISAGAVSGAELYIKQAKSGTATTDWKLVTVAI
jgi:hypothetical protein